MFDYEKFNKNIENLKIDLSDNIIHDIAENTKVTKEDISKINKMMISNRTSNNRQFIIMLIVASIAALAAVATLLITLF